MNLKRLIRCTRGQSDEQEMSSKRSGLGFCESLETAVILISSLLKNIRSKLKVSAVL